MMIHERNRAKEKLFSYLNSCGKLTRDSLHDHLKWLSAENPDWKLACNYMKLIAVSLTTKNIFIKENYDAMLDSLIGQIVDILHRNKSLRH